MGLRTAPQTVPFLLVMKYSSTSSSEAVTSRTCMCVSLLNHSHPYSLRYHKTLLLSSHHSQCQLLHLPDLRPQWEPRSLGSPINLSQASNSSSSSSQVSLPAMVSRSRLPRPLPPVHSHHSMQRRDHLVVPGVTHPLLIGNLQLRTKAHR